jgi:cell wall-associated NlpC family hydrolase
MSIDAVVGRIGQIIQMQQQLTDPAAASTATAAASATGTTGSSSGSSSFSSALASALGSGYSTTPSATDPTALADSSLLAGLNPSALPTTIPSTSTLASPPGSLAAGLVSPTGTAPSATAGAGGAQVNAMVNAANSLLGKPYVIGGGHGGWGPSSGYDCSGFVSAVLHAGGYLSQPVDTTALPSQPGIEAGPGQYVTIFDRALPGQSGHVIIDLNGQFYESGGSAGAWGGGGGVQKIGQPSAAYLATFPSVLHPSGL